MQEKESKHPQRHRRCQTGTGAATNLFVRKPHRSDGSKAVRRNILQGLGFECTVHQVLCIVGRVPFIYVSWSTPGTELFFYPDSYIILYTVHSLNSVLHLLILYPVCNGLCRYLLRESIFLTKEPLICN